jgi:hypothetical protein
LKSGRRPGSKNFGSYEESFGSAFSPIFVNNTIVNSDIGVSVGNGGGNQCDATIEDCIFTGCATAIERANSLSDSVDYNCFYDNAANFSGYPSTFGVILTTNRNGTPSDVLYNILQDPLFVATNDFHLTTNSPCINAGAPGEEFENMCSPPSQGTAFPDLGAYGGPDACNWLVVVPLLPVQSSMTLSNNVATLNWGAIPRSTYQVQYVTNIVGLPQTNNWQNLTNGNVTAVETPTSIVIVTTNSPRKFFRIQSLGRADGN